MFCMMYKVFLKASVMNVYFGTMPKDTFWSFCDAEEQQDVALSLLIGQEGVILMGSFDVTVFCHFPRTHIYISIGGISSSLKMKVYCHSQRTREDVPYHPTATANTQSAPKSDMQYLLARACGGWAVCVRAVDCWQWRSGHYNHQSFPFFPRF